MQLTLYQPEYQLVNVLTIDILVPAHGSFMLKTKAFIEPNNTLVACGDLAPNPVEIEEVKGIIYEQAECSGPHRLPALCGIA